MLERISGMQDPKLRYPAPDPLSKVRQIETSSGLDETESPEGEPPRIEGVARSVGQHAMDSVPDVRIRRLPVSYNEQLKGLKERQRFMPY